MFVLSKDATKMVRACYRDGKMSQAFDMIRYIGDGQGSDLFSMFSKQSLAEIIHNQTGVPYVFIYNQLPKKMDRHQFLQWKVKFEKRLTDESLSWMAMWQRLEGVVWC